MEDMTSTLPRSECPPKLPTTKMRKTNRSGKGQVAH